MSFAAKYNKRSKFDIDTTGYNYVTMKELVENYGIDKKYQIAALYINTKGRFEDHPVAVIPEYKLLLDLPSHMTESVKMILGDEHDCEDINNGLVGIQLEEYVSKTYNRPCIGVRWLDL